MTMHFHRLFQKKPEYILRPVEPGERREDGPQYHLYRLVNGEYQRLPFKEHVEQVYEAKMGKPLDLENPKTFNEKIQWLKVCDQRQEQITCVDKIAVREYIKNLLGGQDIAIPIIQIAEKFSELDFRSPCVVKASHDSGSTRLINKRSCWRRAKRKIKKRLKKTYGMSGAEWSYSFVKPRVLIEKMIKNNIDYKFHCCQGDIKFVQIVRERDKGVPEEIITDNMGKSLQLHLDEKMRNIASSANIPDNWGELKYIASAISQSFKYARVDLYSSDGKVFFGEITFWPRGGLYKTDDDYKFGEIIDLDTKSKTTPIVV